MAERGELFPAVGFLPQSSPLAPFVARHNVVVILQFVITHTPCEPGCSKYTQTPGLWQTSKDILTSDTAGLEWQLNVPLGDSRGDGGAWVSAWMWTFYLSPPSQAHAVHSTTYVRNMVKHMKNLLKLHRRMKEQQMEGHKMLLTQQESGRPWQNSSTASVEL